jgi:MFS family permease
MSISAHASPDLVANPTVSPVAHRKAIIASALGNATEWFDYGIYAYSLVFISAAIFPGSQANAIFFGLATFAISFLIRPLGALFWGPLGDRIGRKQVLSLTLMMMSAATFLIGLLPTYQSAGWYAPAALLVLRMAQGFATGGEYSGAATFLAECAPDSRRGFFGSFLEFGNLAGYISGALVTLGVSLAIGQDAMYEWGWRVPFLIAAPLGLIGFYLRTRIEESPVFVEHERSKASQPAHAKTSVWEILGKYRRPALALTVLVAAVNISNYILMAYMPTYMHKELGASENMSLITPIAGMLVTMAFIPLAGRLSDIIGFKKMWYFSLIGLFILAIPMFKLMATGLTGSMIGFAVLCFFFVPQLATISGMFPAMFPTPVRYAALAIVYNVSVSLFGGTTPMVCDQLIALLGTAQAPAYYIMLGSVLGIAALSFVIETKGCSIRGDGIPGLE